MPAVEKTSTVLTGVVEKIIQPVLEGEPEKAQIAVEGADHLYRELRIENNMVNEKGEPGKHPCRADSPLRKSSRCAVPMECFAGF